MARRKPLQLTRGTYAASLLALVIAAVYLILFLVRLRHNLHEVTWDSDYASGFTVPETVASSGTGGSTVLASSGQWVSLWFGLLTASLPLHRELWEIAPSLLILGSALVIGWSVAQVSSRRAALAAVLLILVASPRALAFWMAALAHNAVYPCTALLGGYLVWLTRAEERGRTLRLLVPPLAGVVVGACLASDLVLAASGLVPFAGTAILAGVRRQRNSRVLALSAATTVLVSVPAALLTSKIMHAQGFITLPAPEKVAPGAELLPHAKLLFKGLKELFNGYLFSEGTGVLHSELGFACIALMLAAFLAVIVYGAATLGKFLAGGFRRGRSEAPASLALSLHTIFWTASLLSACAAFWLTAETGGLDDHSSYYATALFSVAALVPVILGGGERRWAILAVGASVFFAASLVGLSDNFKQSPRQLAIAHNESALVRLAQSNHATVGYAGYWEASDYTWNTGGRITVRPVQECPNPEGPDVCPFYLERVPSWYVPATRASFLLVDPDESWLSSLPNGLGRPIARYTLGSMQMYVYPYDIASRLGPAL
jgi:hypothetical protein